MRIEVRMDRSALLCHCHSKLASKSAADAKEAILLLDSEDLKGDPPVSSFCVTGSSHALTFFAQVAAYLSSVLAEGRVALDKVRGAIIHPEAFCRPFSLSLTLTRMSLGLSRLLHAPLPGVLAAQSSCFPLHRPHHLTQWSR